METKGDFKLSSSNRELAYEIAWGLNSPFGRDLDDMRNRRERDTTGAMLEAWQLAARCRKKRTLWLGHK